MLGKSKCNYCKTKIEGKIYIYGIKKFCSIDCKKDYLKNVKKKTKLKKKSVKMRTLDNKWSLCIRGRDKYRCQKCGNSAMRVEAHHIVRRSFMNTRFLLENGITLCLKCHDEAEKSRFTFNMWLLEKKGIDVSMLEELANKPYIKDYDYWNRILSSSLKNINDTDK